MNRNYLNIKLVNNLNLNIMKTLVFLLFATLSLSSCKKHKEEREWKTYYGTYFSEERILIYSEEDTLFFDQIVLQKDFEAFATDKNYNSEPSNVFKVEKHNIYDYKLNYTRTNLFITNENGELIDQSQSYQSFNLNSFYITKVGENLTFTIVKENGTIQTHQLIKN